MTAAEHELVVREFLTALGPEPGDVRAAVARFLTEDCVWENPGSPVCRGREQILELMPPDFARLEFRIRHLACHGDTVLVERMESLLRSDGSPIARNLKVMGAFEVRGDRISAWRDYFDVTNLISDCAEW
jgi:limonene-1,2-epoxide hydrolase